MENQMKKERSHRPVWGVSREEEEQQLKQIIGVAQQNLERTESDIRALTGELYDLMETYGPKDKEALFLLHNTQSRLQEEKHDLLRKQKARKKPYFGRIDIKDAKLPYEESYYVGRVGIREQGGEPLVIDWRAPAASVYYEGATGPCRYVVKDEGVCEVDLRRKRTYEIEDDRLKDCYDSDVVANDELLTQYLAKNKGAVLGEIIATIQKEQNELIRRSPRTNLIVQGVAGSGKTTVAMHRISYILYNYGEEFHPEDFYIIGSNRILLHYITGVLPDLDVYGVSQMTMEQMFVQILWEEWDDSRHTVRPVEKMNDDACRKGGYDWFLDLEAFCAAYENQRIPQEGVRMEETDVLLLDTDTIRNYMEQNRRTSMANKIGMLNEMLLARLENELTGKYISYPADKKKELRRRYRYWFGREDKTPSVFDIYRDFLTAQAAAGKKVAANETSFDVYDLAALAYLSKRIREIEPVHEASHVIIDEAQDFGMTAYGALVYCLKGCTYTIMGDVSQNIHYGYGLNGWKELRDLVLTGPFDGFGLLKKSYRNTVEISEFATEILRHGSFPIYPVEPVCRHGNAVRVTACEGEDGLLSETVHTIEGWQKDGRETIAVICRDAKEAAEVSNGLSRFLTLADSDLETAEFGKGIMVLPIEYTKGLEFDAVVLFDPSMTSYPPGDACVKLLYVAATRALHELAVLHRGDLTDLIKAAVSEEKRMSSLENEILKEVHRFEKKEYTTKEIERANAAWGEKVRAERNFLGPRPVEVIKPVKRGGQEETAAGSIRSGQESREPGSRAAGSIRSGQESREPGSHAAGSIRRGESSREPGSRAAGGNQAVCTSPYCFGEIPDNSRLRPKGHSRIDCSVRMVKKTKKQIDLISSYGILRLTPLADDLIRVQFKKGGMAEFEPGCFSAAASQNISWTAKEGRGLVEVSTAGLTVRTDKKTGAVQFLRRDKTLLLAEKAALPRQIDSMTLETWNYFDWQKKEKLFAKGILADEQLRMSQKAAYISYGGKKLRMPLLISEYGYGIAVAAEKTVLCCDIPAYGPYLYTDGTEQIDYYFLDGGSTAGVLERYRRL
jgi:DNA helicase-2/ATP-dependent DNA helicase PcrA